MAARETRSSPEVSTVPQSPGGAAHHAAATGSEQAGGSQRRVVTDRAMTTTAALLTALRCRGLSPGRSRVVIAGAATMPELRPLLLAAGVGCVTSWDRRDAVMFPLRWITRNAEAVVDLLGCSRELAEAASDHPELIIIFPDQTSWTRLALPGLLRAAATAQDPKSGIAGYHAWCWPWSPPPHPTGCCPTRGTRRWTSMVEQAVSRTTS